MENKSGLQPVKFIQLINRRFAVKIEEIITQKKSELESLQNDINNLEEQAKGLKDTVKKYNELKRKSKELKNLQTQKLSAFDTVKSFFENVDDSYLAELYPLFGNKLNNTQEIKSGEAA